MGYNPGTTTSPDDPFERYRRNQAQQARETREALAASGTQSYQAVAKLKAALQELEAHAATLLDHTSELGVHTTNIAELLSRLANAGIVSSGEWWGSVRDPGTAAWWTGAAPTVTITTLSGKLRVVYGGIQVEGDDTADGNTQITFAVDGVRQTGAGFEMDARDWMPIQREKFITVTPNRPHTLRLEWYYKLTSGWISVQPLL